MKNILFLLFIVLIFSGCSQETKTEEEQVKKDVPEVFDQGKVHNQKGKTEDSENIYQRDNQKYTIHFDGRLGEELIIEEEGTQTQIFYDDKTIIKDKVLIGSIQAFSLERWGIKESKYEYRFVYYDDVNKTAYVYKAVNLDPYESYYMSKDGISHEPLDEATKYFQTAALVHISLIKSNFINDAIERTQVIPSQLDSNKVIGIQLSERYFTDIAAWYNILKNKQETGSTEDFFRTREQLSFEVNAKYPELRQIPFPTYEIGKNISRSLDKLRYLNSESDFPNEVALLYEEVNIRIIEQYLEVIKTQLEEINNNR